MPVAKGPVVRRCGINRPHTAVPPVWGWSIVETAQRWLLECTPAFASQLERLDRFLAPDSRPGIDGILLTHAHIGHYAGLLQLGREVMGTRNVPVYAMPRMRQFLTDNGPWSQLVALSNIELRALEADVSVPLNERIRVTPLLVPHRDEFSETVAFLIAGPQRRVLFLPDIDKWDRWERAIEDVIGDVDVALLDGTFYANGEIPNRDMSEIPHPFIQESLQRFSQLPAKARAKIRFIHFNHTNPALRPASEAARSIQAAGFGLAQEGDVVDL